MRSRSGLWGYSPLRELLVSEVYMGIHAGGRDSLLKSSSTIIAPSYRRISIHGIVRQSRLDSPRALVHSCLLARTTAYS